MGLIKQNLDLLRYITIGKRMTRFAVFLLVFKLLPNKKMANFIVGIAEKPHLINKDNIAIKSIVNTTNSYYHMICSKGS